MTDMKKIVNKTDAHTDEINAYCSSFVFVTGCLYQMTLNCFHWIHSFAIHGWYKNFKDLEVVLIYLSLTAVSNSEIHRFVIDSSNSIVFNTWGAHWNVSTDDELESSKSIFLMKDNNAYRKLYWTNDIPKCEDIMMTTLESLLQEHYTNDFKEQKRDGKYCNNFKETVKNNIDFNLALIDDIPLNDNEPPIDENSDDYSIDKNIGTCQKASGLSFSISKAIEMLYEHGGDEMKNFKNAVYSLEDIINSLAMVKLMKSAYGDIKYHLVYERVALVSRI